MDKLNRLLGGERGSIAIQVFVTVRAVLCFALSKLGRDRVILSRCVGNGCAFVACLHPKDLDLKRILASGQDVTFCELYKTPLSSEV